MDEEIEVCDICDGTGKIEIDPIGPEQDSVIDDCICQFDEII